VEDKFDETRIPRLRILNKIAASHPQELAVKVVRLTIVGGITTASLRANIERILNSDTARKGSCSEGQGQGIIGNIN
jgi:hypothetical protein